MPAYPVIGGQWGDEGKGKVVDFLSKDTDCIVRFAGGSNAGHTVINDNGEFRLHLVPSGIFASQASSVIGNGMVVDPDVLLQELEELTSRGVDTNRLYVSQRAHLIMPYHILLDQLEEERRSQGAGAIGTTGRGVGPAYTDKTSRIGLRVGDLLDKQHLRDRLAQVMELKNKMITRVYDGEALSVDEVHEKCLSWREKLYGHITDTEGIIQDTLNDGGKVLLEGAQGTLLDLDHGTYPYVTSSWPSVGGACIGMGISPKHIEKITGIFKAYCTRVGSGPMPTEMQDATGELLREKAGEYGATTGRPRRLGWFDAVAGRYSVGLNGFHSLVLTRLDILDGLPSVKICVGYRAADEEVNRFPADTLLLERCEPVYEEMSGWDNPTAGSTQMSQLPQEAIAYLTRLEELVGCSFSMVSTGPKREETIVLN